ncbi:MAG: polymerase Rpb6 [Blastocatellia bacterium]|jgi:DNA-directed RNA polymerase omega subunit|nr:polymerase Rpb6 [Blastocatellia bacterium]
MNPIDQFKTKPFGAGANTEQWPGIDSAFRLIVIAGLRSKQLVRGATPRIDLHSQKRKNISIALEEVREGLVPFTTTEVAVKTYGSNVIWRVGK